LGFKRGFHESDFHQAFNLRIEPTQIGRELISNGSGSAFCVLSRDGA